MNKINEFLKESNAIEGVFDEQSLVDALKAWQYIEKQKKLSLPNVLETHKILMRNQSLDKRWKGKLRTVPVWIGLREGSNWRTLPYNIMNWIDKANRIKTINEIKQDHVEYEDLHPFADGNGRTGRIFMNWQMIKNGFDILIIKEEERQEYYTWFNLLQ